MEQYDIFGGMSEPQEPKKETRRYPKMQERFGFLPGETCGGCGHLVKRQWGKVYYKCELWVMSHCSATDIRKKDKACLRWIPGKKDEE